MKRTTLFAYACLALGGCLGSAATNVGETDEYPLFRVDTKAIPIVITDGTGTSAQVINGKLTVYSSRSDAVYHIEMSNGKSIDGTKDILSDVTTVLDGVRIIADLSAAGGPVGPHSYDFNTTSKQCTCGKFCNRACIGDRLLDSARFLRGIPPGPARVDRYRNGLAIR
jgi:hypothetical protein